jgi:hypothetical protein
MYPRIKKNKVVILIVLNCQIQYEELIHQSRPCYRNLGLVNYVKLHLLPTLYLFNTIYLKYFIMSESWNKNNFIVFVVGLCFPAIFIYSTYQENMTTVCGGEGAIGETWTTSKVADGRNEKCSISYFEPSFRLTYSWKCKTIFHTKISTFFFYVKLLFLWKTYCLCVEACITIRLNKA